MLKKLALKGLISVIGAFFISLAVGIVYLWGIITIYATSYFRIVALSSSITEDLTNIVFPLTLLGQAISMPIVTRYASKVSARITCLIGGIVMSSLTHLSSLTHDFYTFALLFGLGNGVVIGVMYILPISNCYCFFPRNRKFLSMVITSASGIGTIVFALMAEDCMNPHNLSLKEAGYNLFYGKEVSNYFPRYIRNLSTTLLVFVCGGALLLFQPPLRSNYQLKKQIQAQQNNNQLRQLMNLEFTLFDQQSQINKKNPFQNSDYQMQEIQQGYNQKMVIIEKLYGQKSSKVIWPSLERQSEYQPPHIANIQTNTSIKTQKNISTPIPYVQKQNFGECPRTRDGPRQYIFWALFLIIVFGSNFGLMISVNYRISTKAIISDSYYMTMMGSLGAVACGFSRFIWGSILLKSNFKFLYYSISIINIFVSLTIPLVMDSKQIYFTYVILAYICYGGHLGIFPAVASQIFGKRYGPQIYGILFFAFPCSNYIQYLLVNYLDYGYAWIFKISGLLSIFALFIVSRIELTHDWSSRIRQNNQTKRMVAR